MQDNRLTQRLVHYWEMLRKDAAMPDFNHFDHHAISDIWQRCFQLLITHTEGKKVLYTYEFIGADIIDTYGRDLTGMSLHSQAKEFPGTRILARIDEMLDTRKPLTDEGQFISDKHHMVKYRGCLVPFGNELKGVTHVIAGLSWREFK